MKSFMLIIIFSYVNVLREAESITCSTGCISCTSPTVCTQCQSYYYLYLGSCTQTCPNGYYSSGCCGSCMACDYGCLTCGSYSYQCYTCTNTTNGTYYRQYQVSGCKTNCTDGSYKDDSTNECKGCLTALPGCMICTSAIVCAQCYGGYYLYLSSCVQKCPDGYYSSGGGGSCKLCNQGCVTCVSYPDNCASCTNTTNGVFYLYNGNCTKTCPSNPGYGMYKDDFTNTCKNCSTKCSACTEPSTCTQCYGYYFYQSTCLQTCPAGLYGNYSNYLCMACNQGCVTCQGTSSTCTSCTNTSNGNYYLLNGNSCTKTCPSNPGYGLYGDNSTNTCKNCSTGCSACTQPSNCTQCYYYYLYQSTCLQVCPAGLYGNYSNYLCMACDQGCVTCLGTSYSCPSCTNTSNGNYYLYNSYTCTKTCPSLGAGHGLYGDNSTNKCTNCSNSCTTCTSASICTQCIGRYLHENVCVTACPSGYYGDNILYKCVICSIGCALCYTASYCTSCKNQSGTPYFLNQSTCTTNCPAGFYGNGSTNLCTACSSICATCSSSASACSSCKNQSGAAYYLSNNNCITSCPTGTYGNNLTNACAACPAGCLACSSTTSCSSCKNQSGTPYFLNQTTCITTCPAGFYGNSSTNLCTACSATCATCPSSASACSSCKTQSGITYYLSNSTCITTCPTGEYGDNQRNICLACPIGCQICQSASSCSSCKASVDETYFLSNKICIKGCLQGFYRDDNISQCVACKVGCLACSSLSTCSSCKNETDGIYYLNGKTCSKTCWTNSYPNNLTNQCICLERYTKNSVTFKCQCFLFTHDGKCLSECKNDTYISGITGNTICRNCSTLSGTCQSAITIKLQTKVVQSGLKVQHSLYFSKGLDDKLNQQTLKSSIKIAVSVRKSNRLLLKQTRSLAEQVSLIPVIDLTISPDHQNVLAYTSNYASNLDLKSTAVSVSFSEGVLTNSQGQTYTSITDPFELTDSLFMKSYYEASSVSYTWMIEGFIFCALGLVLGIVALALNTEKPLHEIINFIMIVQAIGLLRMRVYSLNWDVYNFLSGFACYEFQHIPNWLKYLNQTKSQNAKNLPRAIQFSLQSDNIIVNNGSEIQLFLLLELFLLICLLWTINSKRINSRTKQCQQILLCLFMPKSIFSCVLSIYSFSQNISNLLSLSIGSWVNYGVSLTIVLAYSIYFVFWVRNQIKYQLYKFQSLIRSVSIFLVILYSLYGIIALNVAELIFFIIDFYFNNKRKVNKYLFIIQNALYITAINWVLFIEDLYILNALLGFGFGIAACIMISYIIKSYNKSRNYINKNELQGESQPNIKKYSRKQKTKSKLQYSQQKQKQINKYSQKHENQSSVYQINNDKFEDLQIQSRNQEKQSPQITKNSYHNRNRKLKRPRKMQVYQDQFNTRSLNIVPIYEDRRSYRRRQYDQTFEEDIQFHPQESNQGMRQNFQFHSKFPSQSKFQVMKIQQGRSNRYNRRQNKNRRKL